MVSYDYERDGDDIVLPRASVQAMLYGWRKMANFWSTHNCDDDGNLIDA